jgi:aminoglycoside phosphotransferase (APT) family kinase protein
MGFDLAWERRHARMMLRMDPAESHNATSRLREFELLQAFDGVIPVPPVYWVDDEARHFPEPVLIYGFVDGVTKPRRTTTGQVSGMGTNFGPELRARLRPQYMEHLAAIHTLEPPAFASMDVPEVGTTQAALWQLNRARRVWEEDRGEDVLLMEVAASWLERNVPVLDRVSVVHGDYRSGNFLFDEETARITGWLDWERGHLGDRHRDLAWSTQPILGHYAEDGRTYLVAGLVPLDDFYAEYERVSGLSVDPQRVLWHRILNAYAIIASTLGTAYRVVRLGKTHQDVLLARVEGVWPTVAAELATLLEEVL